ncbi:hypothetical protein BAUCODRAFT_513648 [Baudoinia panamericana UAMH 10762]|uniref:Uncharacterized protein n=1 Tax=Baudoinia panamericana (strain UAMH 10762) TaxID=717646 RepID=M2MWW1_BAUPA|nr:uncharacterized protein BAUCODRAFT_513648 [Baudoinia panamericana UAMH 10762]EMC96013.1 hypothetical protein BAUCODRAFT_513648 [Baudoinia panamericana UAMH 10762]
MDCLERRIVIQIAVSAASPLKGRSCRSQLIQLAQMEQRFTSTAQTPRQRHATITQPP